MVPRTGSKDRQSGFADISPILMELGQIFQNKQIDSESHSRPQIMRLGERLSNEKRERVRKRIYRMVERA